MTKMTESERYAAARDIERYGALARMMEKWAASSEGKFIKAWREFSHVGYRCDTVSRPYSVTERGNGYCVVTFDDDGSTRTIEAPMPFA